MTQKNIDKRTLFTILAALRHYQADLPRANIDTEILDIATESDTIDPLSEDEIDELCEALNTLPLSLAKHPSPPRSPPPANDVLANALKLTILCCIEALTADWDKSDAGFISLIDAAQDALTACGIDNGEHDYADTTPEQLEALQDNLSDDADLATVVPSKRKPKTL